MPRCMSVLAPIVYKYNAMEGSIQVDVRHTAETALETRWDQDSLTQITSRGRVDLVMGFCVSVTPHAVEVLPPVPDQLGPGVLWPWGGADLVRPVRVEWGCLDLVVPCRGQGQRKEWCQ